MMRKTDMDKGDDLLSTTSSGRKGSGRPVRLEPITWDGDKRVVRLIDQTLQIGRAHV